MNFFEKYDVVFDESGDVKLCGRNACRDLIFAAAAISPNQNFGDVNSGYMNVENIKKLHDVLKKETQT